jgi:predicted porin
LVLSGTDYTDSDAPSNDRFTWELYNQFRYQLSPQTVLTADYRYGQTTGNGYASDSTNQYLLVGAEHRLSPNTIAIIRAGAQFRDVDDRGDETSPYVEFSLNSQLTEALRIRSFVRYGIEDYDTVQYLQTGIAEYADRRTLRFGMNAEYVISPMLSLNGGIDYIPTDYKSGEYVAGPNAGSSAPDGNEDLINAYIGVSIRFNDILTGMVSYNYTDSSSDDDRRDYDRNRVSVGLSAEF